MEKCWSEVTLISKNVLGVIISMDIYDFEIIHIFKNKYIKFIIICKFFFK